MNFHSEYEFGIEYEIIGLLSFFSLHILNLYFLYCLNL